MSRNYLSMAGMLVDRTGVESGHRVLDIGTGTGNVAITAARRDAEVTGVDIAPAMLEQAEGNADLADVAVDWYEGDATDLPFESDRFDVTLSALGHMYGDPPDAAAEEFCRVTRPGGRFAFTAWTPVGLLPAMAGVLVSYLPPVDRPEVSAPPFLWGNPDVVRDRLGSAVEGLEFETATATYPAMSPEHFWRELTTRSGIFGTFLEAVPDADRPELRDESIEAIEPHFDGRENAVRLEYLLTTGAVRSGA